MWRDMLLRRMLAVADAASALLATLLLSVTGSAGVDVVFWALIFLPVWILLAKSFRLYDRDHTTIRHLTIDELAAIVLWAITGTAVVSALVTLTPAPGITLASAVRLAAVVAISAFVLRSVARLAWRRLTPRERTLIVGRGPVADATRRKLELFPDIHVVVDREEDEDAVASELRDGGTLADVDRVIFASHAIDEHFFAELVAACRRSSIKLSLVPPARGMFGTAVHLNHVADLPIVEYNTWDTARSTLLLKRALDIAVAGTALPLLAPLFLVVALGIRLESRGPVFFRQVRAGQFAEPFSIVKFRTMAADAEARLVDVVHLDRLEEPMFKLPRDPRVTRVGRILRRTSIDELPQLWNVLRGEMSLVGPRPEQVELVERYTPEQRIRLGVKPGMTGPMQVFGRGQLTFEERLAVEREYIENLSLARDFRILLLTLPVVSRMRGAY